MDPAVLDDFNHRLLEVWDTRPRKHVQLSDTYASLPRPCNKPTCASVKPLFCGDIHGHYFDLLQLFKYGRIPPDANYLFRRQSLKTIYLLLAYKIKYPENLFLLTANLECASINRIAWIHIDSIQLSWHSLHPKAGSISPHCSANGQLPPSHLVNALLDGPPNLQPTLFPLSVFRFSPPCLQTAPNSTRSVAPVGLPLQQRCLSL
ncbi:hypothetical protein L7F22_001523 [Adiantum nelumboides]|nr:hypothetical protein [Adiantum nelumboides]